MNKYYSYIYMYSISSKFNNNKLIEHYNTSEKLAAKGITSSKDTNDILSQKTSRKVAELTNQSTSPSVLIDSNENVTYTAPTSTEVQTTPSSTESNAGGISFNILLFVFVVAVLCMYFKHKQKCE